MREGLGLTMASTRAIRKLHQIQTATTIAVRKVLKHWGEGSVTFACAEDAAAYLRSITDQAESHSLALIHTGEAIIPKAYR